MEIDLKQLGAWLMETGLMHKAFQDFEEIEIQDFCEQVHLASIYIDREYRPPYIKNDELIIPADAHPKHRYWAKGQSIKKTLEELNASTKIIERYAPARDFEGLPRGTKN